MKVAGLRGALAVAALSSCTTVSQVGHREAPLVYQAEHVSLTVGRRSFEDDLSEPVDDQLYFALNIEVEPVGSWLALDFGLNFSRDRATQSSGGLGIVDLEVDVWELSAGLHHEIRLGEFPIRPYLGAGASILLVDATLTDQADVNLFEDQDTTFGAYARAGLLFDLRGGSQIGIDVRYLNGDAVNIGGLVVDSDYTAIGLIFRGSY